MTSFFTEIRGIGSFRADLVRLRAGPPGWETAGPECETVPGDCSGSYAAQHQDVHPGSYALIPGGGRALADGPVSLVLLVHPTHRAAAPQVLVSAGDPWAGPGVALILDEQLQPALITGPGAAAALTGPGALEINSWSVVTATFGGDAPGQLAAGPLSGGAGSWSSVTGPVPAAWPGPAGPGSLVLGAVMSAAGTTRKPFTGRLESPVITAGAVSPDRARALMAAGPDHTAGGTVRAAWDFSVGIGTWAITDRGPLGLHGTLHNLPMRAVRGARWTGRHHDWREAPG
jgi:N,N-dimethylformamidase